jgi:glycosyltransferase involved in cell wall biosynthesis
MTSAQPLLSIVTPVYNQADYVAETIDSVLAQDLPGVEYLVLDDGSTDDTPAVLKRYAGRVDARRHDNIGQARTLNQGWSAARGKYLAYLSSDDILYPGALRRLVEVLENDPSVVCVFPDCDLIDERSRVIKRNVCRPFDLGDLVVRQECHIAVGAVFRKDAFERVGGWRPELRLAPDREFWMRLAEHGKFHFLPQTLAGYRMHTQSISYKDVSEAVGREYLWVLDQYFAGPNVAPAISGRRDEAYGHAKLVLARNCFRAGDFRRGMELYREACRLHPALAGWNVRLRLVRNVVSKPIRIGIATARRLVRV